MLRRRWPEVLDTLSRLRKATWALVAQNAQVAELTDSTLRLTFASAGLATAFRNGPGAELVQRAIRETLGFDVRVEGGIEEPGRAPARPAATDPGAQSPAARSVPIGTVAGIDPAAAAASWDVPATPATPATPPPAAAAAPSRPSAPASPAAAPRPAAEPGTESSEARAASPADAPVAVATAEFGEEPPGDFDHEPAPEFVRSRPAGGAAPTESPRQAAERRVAASRAQEEARAKIVDDPQPDDEDLASSGQVGAPLVAQILGGVVIEEILDSEV